MADIVEYAIVCPKCGCNEAIVEGKGYWWTDLPTKCKDCGYEGTLKDFVPLPWPQPITEDTDSMAEAAAEDLRSLHEEQEKKKRGLDIPRVNVK